MMALNWYTVLHFKKCVHCGSPKKKGRRGFQHTFCEYCEAKLPDVLSWHLDTACSVIMYLTKMRYYEYHRKDRPVKFWGRIEMEEGGGIGPQCP